MLKQRLVRWLGQVVQMDDDRMPKKLLHKKLSQETSPTGRPQLRFKDVCQRDLKPLQINTETEEATASDRQHRRQAVNQGLWPLPEVVGIPVRTCYCLYLAHAFYGWCIYALYNKEQNKKTTLKKRNNGGQRKKRDLRSN